MADVASVSVSDYADVSAFLAAFPGDESGDATAWIGRFRSWWDLNPAFKETMTRGWALRERNAIVGFLGAIPWKFQLGGRETTVFAGTTWRVLPEFRGMSLALKRRQMQEHGGALHLSTTPRPEVQRLLALLGYAPLHQGNGAEYHSAIILDFEKLLRTKLEGRKRLAGAAAWAAPSLRVVQDLRLRRLADRGRWTVKHVRHADAAFDDLWNRTKEFVPTTHVRTADTVNWYCFSSPDPNKTLIGCYEGGLLAGYAVFLSTERRGVRIFECVDLWTELGRRRESIVRALVRAARRQAEALSCDRVNLPHFDDWTAATYRRLGLIRMSAPRRPGFYSGPSLLMRQLRPENSYLVLGEGDYGL